MSAEILKEISNQIIDLQDHILRKILLDSPHSCKIIKVLTEKFPYEQRMHLEYAYQMALGLV